MKTKAMIKNYFKAITNVASQGDAREESFYSCLKALLQRVAASTGRSEFHVTTLPKKTEAGNPDFRVWNGQDRIIGYIEAKKPTEENLDYVETTDQLKRYRQTFPNLILTNFLEFGLYRDGQLVDRVSLRTRRGARLRQQNPVLRARPPGAVGIPDRRLPGAGEVAQGSPRPAA